MGNDSDYDRDPKSLLAANLAKLLDYYKAKGDMELGTAVGLEGRCGVSDSLISRYKLGQASASLEHLDRIAWAYGLQAWQLLFPTLEPANPPVLPYTSTEMELYKVLKAGAEVLARSGGLNGVVVGDTSAADDRGTDSKVPSQEPRPRKSKYR